MAQTVVYSDTQKKYQKINMKIKRYVPGKLTVTTRIF